MSQTITIATLNLWRFNEWEKRLPLIIELLKKTNPDIVFLQEVQRDISQSPLNQVEILNNALNYPFSEFSVADIKTTRKGVPLSHPVDHGLGLLSKFPCTTEIVMLTKGEGDKEQRIIQINTFDSGGKSITLTNVHFSNSDQWAEAHLKETLGIIKSRGLISVLAGDFNSKNISDYHTMFDEDYVSSYEIKKYVSYPNDSLSYDYILVPKTITFKTIECSDDDVSDHRMLMATIVPH